MADSIVRLTVEDSSFNAKIKAAAKAFADFGARVTSAGVDAFKNFATGANTAKVAFQGFNTALKANALVLVATLAVQVGQAIGEMIGDWISGADDAEAAQKKLNDELDRTAQIVKGILAESDFNARIAKAAGKSTSEILQMKYQAADAAYNKAMSALFDPNVKVGTEEYNKAKKMFDEAEKARTKAWQDIQVDNTAREHKTGEYAPKGGGSGRSSKTNIPEYSDFSKLLFNNSKQDLKAEENFQSIWEMIGEAGRKQIAETMEKQWDYGKDISKEWKVDSKGNLTNKPETRAQESMARDLSKFTGYAEKTLGGVGDIVGGLSQLGVDIPKGLQDVLSGIQGITSIVTGIASLVAMIEALTGVQTTESTIKTIPGIGWLLAGGGIVRAAQGYVPGNNYSGDMVPALLNSGELVLNRAQQNSLANELQGNGMQNLRLRTEVSGRNLIVVIENDLKATGKGQLVTFKG
jgi:hypothetical protein